MADLAKIFEDAGGYKLTLAQAKRLYKAKAIAAPTLVALKNYFVNEVIAPKLKEAGKSLSKNPSSRDISNLRKAIPELLAFDVEGNEHNLISLNKLWSAIKTSDKTGKPITNASSFLRDDYRTRAGKGFDKLSLRQADFYDDIDNLRAIRDRDLVGADANKEAAVYSQYDRAMGQLFHNNRDWLPKEGNQPARYSPSKEHLYGWQEGKSREGFLQHQQSSYDLSQDQSRWLAKKLGIKQDAGHVVPLGGMIISDAERKRFFIDESELERNPDGEGWILRGTNSLTNLAIEDAKGNRAKGNLSGRQLEEIIAMNTAFTKTRSLLEYNLTGDKTFIKLPDFSAAIQGLFGHGNRDINELQAIAEDQILQTGVQTTPTLKKSQFPSQKNLVANFQKRPTETIGGLKTTVVNEAGNVLSRRFDPNPPSLLSTKANTIQDTIGSNSLDSSALQPTVKPKPSVVEIQKRERELNQVYDPVTNTFQTKENNPNELQEGVDTARYWATQGFHVAADRYTGGAYGQVRNAFNASQNLMEGNYLGLALNLSQVELKSVEPYYGIWDVKHTNLLNSGPIK